MRIALAANRAAGGGLDPARLVAAMPGAEVLVTADLEGVEAWGPDRLAVAGGDGSVAPAAALAGRLGLPLAVVAAGTANDFARAHGLPLDPLEGARLAATGTALRSLELGRLADGRPFVNAASVGLAAVAARRARPLKRVLGPLAYPVAGVAAATTAPLACALAVDGAELFAGRAWQVIVACTGAFGGGSGVGAADPHDGELDVVLIPAGSRVALARRAWGLRRWTLERQRDVPHHRGRVVEVALAPGTEVNCDGELAAGGLERVTARAGAYSLVVPG